MNNNESPNRLATEHYKPPWSTVRRSSTATGCTPLLRVVTCQGDQRRIEDKLKQHNREVTSNERVLINLASGALAGAVAKTTIAPLDRTKIYFQTTPSTSFSFRAVAKFLVTSYKTGGFTSLWRGNSATMARIIPYAAIQFTAHEQFKVLFRVESKQTHELTRFLCGSLAGVVAQSLTYPLDLSRARLAVSPLQHHITLADVIKQTLRSEGPRGLYKGYVPTMLGVIPYAGCSFYCYEGLKRLWTREFGDSSVGGFERLCFGAVSGIIGQSASYPADIIRRRMQTGVQLGSGVFKMLKVIARTEGIVGGLYKGLSMNWIKGPVAAGISFAMFDWSNLFLREWVQGGN